MEFNFRATLFFSYIAFFSFLLLVIPFNYIILPIQWAIWFIFIVNTLCSFSVFHIKYKIIENISYKFILVLQKLKLYSYNKELWKLNWIHTYLVFCLLYVVYSVPKNIYESIMAGIFSSAVTSIFIFYITFTYEKYKIIQELNKLYQKVFYILNECIDKFNDVLEIKNKQFDSLILENIKNLRIESQSLYNIANGFLYYINKYNDISFISINVFNKILNKKFKENIKKEFIKIICGAINIAIVNNIEMTRNISIRLNDISNNLLKLVVMAQEIEIKLKTANYTNDFNNFFETIEKINHDLLEIKEDYKKLFQEFEKVFNK